MLSFPNAKLQRERDEYFLLKSTQTDLRELQTSYECRHKFTFQTKRIKVNRRIFIAKIKKVIFHFLFLLLLQKPHKLSQPESTFFLMALREVTFTQKHIRSHMKNHLKFHTSKTNKTIKILAKWELLNITKFHFQSFENSKSLNNRLINTRLFSDYVNQIEFVDREFSIGHKCIFNSRTCIQWDRNGTRVQLQKRMQRTANWNEHINQPFLEQPFNGIPKNNTQSTKEFDRKWWFSFAKVFVRKYERECKRKMAVNKSHFSINKQIHQLTDKCEPFECFPHYAIRIARNWISCLIPFTLNCFTFKLNTTRRRRWKTWNEQHYYLLLFHVHNYSLHSHISLQLKHVSRLISIDSTHKKKNILLKQTQKCKCLKQLAKQKEQKKYNKFHFHFYENSRKKWNRKKMLPNKRRNFFKTNNWKQNTVKKQEEKMNEKEKA